MAYRSAEDFIKRIVRIAKGVQIQIEHKHYGRALRLLELIHKFDIELYKRIEEETRSKEIMDYCLQIRSLAEEAIIDARESKYEKTEEVIQKIINAGDKYVLSEERFVGYKIEEYDRPTIKKQALFLTDLIEGITRNDAEQMLQISFDNGLDLVIGGSSISGNKIGGDLDIGFKINKRFKGKIAQKYLNNVVKRTVNRINKKCFGWYKKIFKKVLLQHKWIHDKSALRGIPDIETVEEFFMRCGFRHEPREVLKDGKPFGPSGYAIVYLDGKIQLVTPKIRENTNVGIKKFW